jgi:hypothetical protein
MVRRFFTKRRVMGTLGVDFSGSPPFSLFEAGGKPAAVATAESFDHGLNLCLCAELCAWLLMRSGLRQHGSRRI